MPFGISVLTSPLTLCCIALQGKYDEAELFYRGYLAIQELNEGCDSTVGVSLGNLARILQTQVRSIST